MGPIRCAGLGLLGVEEDVEGEPLGKPLKSRKRGV